MKIFKWIFALIAGIGGILAMMLVPAGNKRKKIKALDKKIKAVDKEALQYFDEIEKMNQKPIWDKTVANALANSNVDMTIKKNKK